MGGAVSVVLAAGYPEDKDEGLHFTYTGSGGKINNSTVQNADQKLTMYNEALARTCDCEFNLDGGTAVDWIKSKPVRVIRSSKLKSHNPAFAPEEGNRYDGIYKLEKVRGFLSYLVRAKRICLLSASHTKRSCLLYIWLVLARERQSRLSCLALSYAPRRRRAGTLD